jgi:hypothetical protein
VEDFHMRRLLVGVGVLVAVAFHTPAGTAKDQPVLGQLRTEVEQQEDDRGCDEMAVAEARGRWALAKGQKPRAAAAFRKLFSYREAQLKALQARLGIVRAAAVALVCREAFEGAEK